MRAQRVVRVPVYWLVVGFATSLLSPVLAVTVSVHVNSRTLAANEAARADAREESRLRYCNLLGSQVEVYKDALTPVGKDAYNTWLTEYRLQRCEPPK